MLNLGRILSNKRVTPAAADATVHEDVPQLEDIPQAPVEDVDEDPRSDLETILAERDDLLAQRAAAEATRQQAVHRGSVTRAAEQVDGIRAIDAQLAQLAEIERHAREDIARRQVSGKLEALVADRVRLVATLEQLGTVRFVRVLQECEAALREYQEVSAEAIALTKRLKEHAATYGSAPEPIRPWIALAVPTFVLYGIRDAAQSLTQLEQFRQHASADRERRIRAQDAAHRGFSARQARTIQIGSNDLTQRHPVPAEETRTLDGRTVRASGLPGDRRR